MSCMPELALQSPALTRQDGSANHHQGQTTLRYSRSSVLLDLALVVVLLSRASNNSNDEDTDEDADEDETGLSSVEAVTFGEDDGDGEEETVAVKSDGKLVSIVEGQ